MQIDREISQIFSVKMTFSIFRVYLHIYLSSRLISVTGKINTIDCDQITCEIVLYLLILISTWRNGKGKFLKQRDKNYQLIKNPMKK